jgi:hypothetical protein
MKKWLLLGVGLAALGSYALAQSPGVNSPYNPVWSIPIDSIKRTYGQALWGLSPTTLITDLFVLCGNANNTTRVTRLIFSGRASAVSPMDVNIIKRSVAPSGGVITGAYPILGTSAVGIPYDTNFGASQSWITAYGGIGAGISANPSVGALVGILASRQYYPGNLTTTVSTYPALEFDFGNNPGSAAVLRGINQCLSINLSGNSYPGAALDIEAQWTEE